MNENACRLIDACCEAYDSYHTSKDVTGDGVPETFCNFSVDHVLARMGYMKMRDPNGSPMMANQMIDFMSRSSDWSRIDMGDAQDLVNEGRVVVAGKTEAPHGHVVVVRPGVAEFSQKYGAKAPKVAHVGRNSYIGRSAAWAFGGGEPPSFWLLKEA